MTVSGANPILNDVLRSQRQWDAAADRVVQASLDADDADLPRAVVGMMAARRGFEATLAVSRRRDEMLGTVIDVLA